MGTSKKKYKQKQQNQRRKYPKDDPPNQKVLDSIGHPNTWTPETEDAWIKELRNIPDGEIHKRFPPMKKPGNVGRRGQGVV